ncbi:MAG: hypothetical protein ABI573_03755 [Chloroflexota bacterium]
MHKRGPGGVSIIDDQDRPTGYLDLLELALVYVRLMGESGDPA